LFKVTLLFKDAGLLDTYLNYIAEHPEPA